MACAIALRPQHMSLPVPMQSSARATVAMRLRLRVEYNASRLLGKSVDGPDMPGSSACVSRLAQRNLKSQPLNYFASTGS